MADEESETDFDKLLKGMKNHPLVAVLIAIGLVVIAFAQFTNAVDDIRRTVGSWLQTRPASEYDGGETSPPASEYSGDTSPATDSGDVLQAGNAYPTGHQRVPLGARVSVLRQVYPSAKFSGGWRTWFALIPDGPFESVRFFAGFSEESDPKITGIEFFFRSDAARDHVRARALAVFGADTVESIHLGERLQWRNINGVDVSIDPLRYSLLAAHQAPPAVSAEPPTPPSISAAPSASEMAAARDPNYHPITLKEYFHTWYDGGLTDLQRDEFRAGLLGKRVVWDGAVLKVASSADDEIYVILGSGDRGGRTVFLDFEPKHRSQLLALKEGQHLRVTCVIKRFLIMPYLHECSIIRIASRNSVTKGKPNDKSASIGKNKSNAMGNPISYEDYLRKYRNLEERFLEQEEFVESKVGKKIIWLVKIISVSSMGESQVSLWFEPVDEEFKTWWRALRFAIFDNTFRDKLFALRRGDVVRVTGIFQANSSFPGGYVEGADVELVTRVEAVGSE